MRRFTHLSGIAALLLVLPAVTVAEGDEKLHRNPFERPSQVEAESAPANGGTKSLDNPGLRAVLVAGSRSVVNFGGELMQIGDTANGYKLLAVKEGTAIFRHNDKTIVLSLYDQDRGSEQ